MATTSATMQNLAIDWGVQDAPSVIADLTKNSGILQTMQVSPANYGYEHRYKRFNTLPAGTFRTFGTGIVPVSFSKDMEKISLWEVSSLMQVDVGEANAHPGGKDGWFDANYPAGLAGLGQTITKQIIYGTELQTGSTYYASQNGFLGLAQYAVMNGQFKEIDTNDTYTGAQSSLHVVRWEKDSGASVRVYPDTRTGNLITVTEYAPQLVVTSTTTNAQQPVYSWLLTAYMSLVIPSATSNYMICGFNATDSFTQPDLTSAIDNVAIGGAGDIKIYANLRGKAVIESLKYAKVAIDTSNTNVNNLVTTWDGVPIYLDGNITTAEYAALYI